MDISVSEVNLRGRHSLNQSIDKSIDILTPSASANLGTHFKKHFKNNKSRLDDQNLTPVREDKHIKGGGMRYNSVHASQGDLKVLNRQEYSVNSLHKKSKDSSS